ncbi:oligosaccharide flippase family protein [Halobacillus sp. Marseille-Q1614]|uniref:putative polysaccharide biosynthesis protein n=1 Tax=Halobacillus sp. Marseille-Q1614 TaxID=2709134 RepID=UPI00156D41E3|nr:oligosaccharide flippase family protein [Halobacillus sp. Marseille-Q1614]
MEHSNASHRLVKGAFLLTLSGLAGKILSAGYRIPLQNIAGDVGFYIYQQVYPILGMALILSLYGFPVAISRLVSDLHEEGMKLSIQAFYIPIFSWVLAICGIIFLTGFTQAEQIAQIMGDEQLVPSLRGAFCVFLFIPFTSVLRGVFQGKGIMEPTAVSQVTEQTVRVIVIIATALYASRTGELYDIGVGGAWSSILGTLAAAIVLWVLWLRQEKPPFAESHKSKVSYVRPILFYGLFISLNYMLLLFFQFVDSLSLVSYLERAGFRVEEARVAKGVFDRGQPLIQLGTVLASSLALALVPSVTRKRLQKDPLQVQKYIFGAVKYSLLVAAGAAAGLIVLFPAVNSLLFQDTAGTDSLRILMVVIIFSSLAITLSSVLQGLGFTGHTAFVILLAVFMKAGLNISLIPLFKESGAAIGSIGAAAFVTGAYLLLLNRDFPLKHWSRLPWKGMAGALSGMVLFLIVLSPLLAFVEHRLALLVSLLIMIGSGAAVYLILLIWLGALEQKELESLPFRDWLVKLLPKGREL